MAWWADLLVGGMLALVWVAAGPRDGLCADFVLFGRLAIAVLTCAGLSGPSVVSSAIVVSSEVSFLVMMMVGVGWVVGKGAVGVSSWRSVSGQAKAKRLSYRDRIIMLGFRIVIVLDRTRAE